MEDFGISDQEYSKNVFPSHLVLEDVAVIVAIELFDRAYTQMLCDLGIPILLIDSYTRAPSNLMLCDLVYTENYASSIALTSRMIASDAKDIGFVGDINHCSSFNLGHSSGLKVGNRKIESLYCFFVQNLI